jgi:hypothetical protein
LKVFIPDCYSMDSFLLFCFYFDIHELFESMKDLEYDAETNQQDIDELQSALFYMGYCGSRPRTVDLMRRLTKSQKTFLQVLGFSAVYQKNPSLLLKVFRMMLPDHAAILNAILYMKDQHGQSLLSNICLHSSEKEKLPDFIKQLIQLLEANKDKLPDYDMTTFLAQKDFTGGSFLHTLALCSTRHRVAGKAVVNLLKYLAEFEDTAALNQIVQIVDVFGENLATLFAFDSENEVEDFIRFFRDNRTKLYLFNLQYFFLEHKNEIEELSFHSRLVEKGLSADDLLDFV